MLSLKLTIVTILVYVKFVSCEELTIFKSAHQKLYHLKYDPPLSPYGNRPFGFTFENATNHCQSMELDLFKPRSKSEMNDLNQIVREMLNFHYASFFIGVQPSPSPSPTPLKYPDGQLVPFDVLLSPHWRQKSECIVLESADMNHLVSTSDCSETKQIVVCEKTFA